MDQTSQLDSPLIFILFGILGMLLLALALIAFFMIYQKRLFAQQDKMRDMEVEYQKDLASSYFAAQEVERKHIASDLHDDVGSILSATRMYLSQLNADLPKNEYEELKVDATSLIDNAIHKIRGISQNLFPPNLEHLGLVQAVSDFCYRIEKMGQLEINFEHHESLSLSKAQELTVYRILQELVNNTMKHSKASRVDIRFETDDVSFKMLYQDNGIGFDPDNKSTAKGLGMKSIKSRANFIGANLLIETQKEKGFRLQLIIDNQNKAVL